MPTAKDEDWRYVEPEFDLDGLVVPGSPGKAMSTGMGVTHLVGEAAGHAVSIDGHTVVANATDGVVVSSLDDAPDGSLGGLDFRPPEDRIAALNDAFAVDGVVIHASQPVRRTVVIDMQATQAGALVAPLLVVRADAHANVTVFIDQRSPDGLPCLVAPRIEAVAAEGARIDIVVVQQWGDATVAAASHRLSGGRDASVGFAEAGFGGSFSRVLLDVSLVGSGADGRVLGAYFGDRDQTLDYRYFMRHMAPSTTSDMFLKGAVGDASKSVFTGLIRIEPEGQKTNAHQTNRNLVLSEAAEAHSVPNLEILADDVRCGHGSAVGPLDEDQRYYLMSRGLPRHRADRVQVKGFFEEVLRRFPVEGIIEELGARALDKYERVSA